MRFNVYPKNLRLNVSRLTPRLTSTTSPSVRFFKLWLTLNKTTPQQTILHTHEKRILDTNYSRTTKHPRSITRMESTSRIQIMEPAFRSWKVINKSHTTLISSTYPTEKFPKYQLNLGKICSHSITFIKWTH